jgi:hypothetical protein
MYADDGIVVSKDPIDLTKYLESDNISTGFKGDVEYHANRASE